MEITVIEYTIQRVLKDYKFHSYKLTLANKLKEDDCDDLLELYESVSKQIFNETQNREKN